MTALQVAMKTLLGSGIALLVLGLIIWTGNGDPLVGEHIGYGVDLELSLWRICAIAARSGVPARTVAVAVTWGVVVVVLGLVQEELFAGGWHWTVQVVHVAVSMGAIWWGRRLAGLIGQRRFDRAVSPARREGALT
jgi:hypothetical protein